MAKKLGASGAGMYVCSTSTPVGGVDEQHVSRSGYRAAAHVVLRNAQLGHHIEDPHHVGFLRQDVRLTARFEQLFFLLIRPVVFAVMKTLGIETTNFAAASDEPEPITLDVRRAADALQGQS